MRSIGINETLVLSELVDKEEYFHREGKLLDGGWFYYTQEDLEFYTTLKRKSQETAIDSLIEKGLIEKKTMGLPCRRHFKINEEKIEDLVRNLKKDSSLYKRDNLVCQSDSKKDYQYGSKEHTESDAKDILPIYNKRTDIQKTDTTTPHSPSSSSNSPKLGVGVVRGDSITEEEMQVDLRSPTSQEVQKMLDDVPLTDENGKPIEEFSERSKMQLMTKYSGEQIKLSINFLNKSSENPNGKEIKSAVAYLIWCLDKGKKYTDNDVKILDYVLECINYYNLRTVSFDENFVFDRESSKELKFTGDSFESFKDKFENSFLPKNDFGGIDD